MVKHFERHQGYKKVHTVLLVALTLAFSGCTEESKAECAEDSPESLLGTYEVKQASRYRGGLTSEEAAQERVGSEVKIGKNQMISDLSSIEKPRYEIECYPAVDKEGEVPAQRFSNFYGLGLDRDSVKVLEVYAEGDPEGEPSYYFEVVNDELWELYDGWLYTLTKPSEP
ncbi:hypothetical protein [Marinimicrobium agarilyticum]|uniref:hypothetical protein n=1 Tax=Marinimicrobium agarilyticum TaxID=306546 RepID=UPI0012F6F532|nr:hypothetical protein [Marinimicrobium agarilyticum]